MKKFRKTDENMIIPILKSQIVLLIGIYELKFGHITTREVRPKVSCDP